MSENSRKKKKKNSGLNAFLVVIIVICIAVIAFCAYKLISTGLEYKKSRDEYSELQKYTSPVIKDDKTGASAAVSASSVSEEEEPDFGCPISVDAESLQKLNGDFAGWLHVEALDISYPVVQGPDNDFYLHRTFEGTYNFSGSLFLDCANKKDFSSAISLIYGHSMKDGSMFGKLKKFTGEAAYNNSRYFWIVTPEHTYRYRIVSLEYTDAYSTAYSIINDAGDDSVSYIRNRAANSSVSFDLPEITAETRAVVLSTCVGAEGDERFIVTGILDMEDGKELYDEEGKRINAGEQDSPAL